MSTGPLGRFSTLRNVTHLWPLAKVEYATDYDHVRSACGVVYRAVDLVPVLSTDRPCRRCEPARNKTPSPLDSGI